MNPIFNEAANDFPSSYVTALAPSKSFLFPIRNTTTS
jgi:hypothetical protein